MWRSRKIAFLLLAVAVWPSAWSQAHAGAGKGITLLTPLEADQLRLTDSEWLQSGRTRSLTLPEGPRIVMQRPSVKETGAGLTIVAGTPTDFYILFEPNQAPVNMDSLQIRARKGIFAKSLTAVLHPYIRGTSLQANTVRIPEGRFRIEIGIADMAGAQTIQTYALEVRGQEQGKR